jgi:ankyrin repeat protein
MKKTLIYLQALWLCMALLLVGCGSESSLEPLTQERNNPLVEGGRWSALHEAVHKGNSIRAMELLSKGIDVNVQSALASDYGVTPLYLACERGDTGLILSLLERGADINKGKSTGASPLHAAVEAGHRAVVELLCSKGAKVDIETLYVHKPLEIAQNLGRKDIVEVLLTASKAQANPKKD